MPIKIFLISTLEFVDNVTPSTSNHRSERIRAAMLKRNSHSRKTISYIEELKKPIERPSINGEMLKNTNRNIYCTSNNSYVLCNEKSQNMAFHYANKHPDHEVFVSRPSPDMVKLIKQQSYKFTHNGQTITGMCYFCEDVKNFAKRGWERHLTTHTGEKLYFCSKCVTSNDTTGSHIGCESPYERIYKGEGPILCYICKHCDYTQLNQ